MGLHPQKPLVALLGLVHLWSAHPVFVLSAPAHAGFALVEGELGDAIKVASTIVPWWIRSMVASGYGGLPPFLLVLG